MRANERVKTVLYLFVDKESCIVKMRGFFFNGKFQSENFYWDNVVVLLIVVLVEKRFLWLLLALKSWFVSTFGNIDERKSYRAYRWRDQRWTLECDLCSDHCQIIVIYYNNFKQINWVLSTPSSTIYHPRSMIHLPKGEIINPFIKILNTNPGYYFGLMTIHKFKSKTFHPDPH